MWSECIVHAAGDYISAIQGCPAATGIISAMSGQLSHIDSTGRARMVDVSDKDVTDRTAVARGEVQMERSTLDLIRDGRVKKGDVISVAELAGVMAAKRTAELIPLCHPLPLSDVQVSIEADEALPGFSVHAAV